MSEGVSALSAPGERPEDVPVGVPAEKFRTVLAAGRARGTLTPDDLMLALEEVELSHEVIEAAVERVKAEGIEYVDDTPVDEEAIAAELAEVEPPAANGSRGAAAAAAPAARARPRPASVPDDESRMGGGTADPVRMYLREIGKVALLTGSQEVSLAQRIKAGDEAQARINALEAQYGPGKVPPDKYLEAEQAMADGELANQALIKANLRLVVSIAKRYRNRGMAFLDLIQEGNLGLMRAVQKFDHTKGFKFSTYATWWIRQAITRAIADQARTIRIPVHMMETINKVVRLQRQMLQELGREPALEELAARVGMTEERVRECLRINQDVISLEQPVGDEDDFSLSDVIEDQEAVVPADAAARTMLNEAVKDVLGQLNDREQEVIRLRFGLDDGQMRTLEEVGKEFGVTRERIRQIEAKTLAKLRHPIRSQRLRDYLDNE